MDTPIDHSISSVIRATQSHTSARIALCDFSALCTAWPSRAEHVLSAVVLSTSGELVRNLYQGSVRSSPLEKMMASPLIWVHTSISHQSRPMAPCRPRCVRGLL